MGGQLDFIFLPETYFYFLGFLKGFAIDNWEVTLTVFSSQLFIYDQFS